MSIATCIAPAHVSVLKNCGTCDEFNNPYTNSISAILDMEFMCAKTTVVTGYEFTEKEFYFNGRYEGTGNVEYERMINELKLFAFAKEDIKGGMVLKVYTENNFLKELGLDSKAAEYAAFVTALAKMYKINGDVSFIARLGYGPACRSMYGGFNNWRVADGNKKYSSVSGPILDAKHWPELLVVILVVKSRKNNTMTNRVGLPKCDYLKFKAKVGSSVKTVSMHKAIYNRNFESFARLTMQESDQTHALYLASYPPIIYMNDISHSIVQFVHLFNDSQGEIEVAYTFEENPNPFLFMMEDSLGDFLAALHHYFPPPVNKIPFEYYKGVDIVAPEWPQPIEDRIKFPKQLPGKIEYIVISRLGEGPKLVSDL